METRVKQLESAIYQLCPDINDVNDLLTSRKAVKTLSPQNMTLSHSTDSCQSAEAKLDISGNGNRVDDFDWYEQDDQRSLSSVSSHCMDRTSSGITTSSNSLSNSPIVPAAGSIDGMAALSLKNLSDRKAKSGYFGMASSSGVLSTLDFDQSNLVPLDGMSLLAKEENSQDQLVDFYFENYHTSYPFINKASFMENYRSKQGRPAMFSLLLNTVLALGHWCKYGESSTVDLTLYYRRVKEILKEINIFECGNITLLESMILLSNYAQKRNKPNTGWNYLGLAVRVATSLGLNREFKHTGNEVLNLEIKKRLWWGLYIFDAGASITFGRPVIVPGTEMCNLQPVSNISDLELAEILAVNPDTPASNLDKPHPTIYSGLIAQTEFTKISISCYNRLMTCRNLSVDEGMQMNTHVSKFIETLPGFFSDPVPDEPKWFTLTRYRLIWRCKNLQMLIFRSFIWKHAKHAQLKDEKTCPEEEKICREICYKVAKDTIDSVSEYVADPANNCILSAWYSTYFLFQATLIPILCLSAEPATSLATDWLADIDIAKKTLIQLARLNKLAGSFVGVIDNLLHSIDTRKESLPSATMSLFSDVGVEFRLKYGSEFKGFNDYMSDGDLSEDSMDEFADIKMEDDYTSVYDDFIESNCI